MNLNPPVGGSTPERGVTWIELTLDFEIATRACLTGYGAQQHQNLNPWQMNSGGPKRTRQRVEGMGDTGVAQRSLNFSRVLKIIQICNGAMPTIKTDVATLRPFGGRS